MKTETITANHVKTLSELFKAWGRNDKQQAAALENQLSTATRTEASHNKEFHKLELQIALANQRANTWETAAQNVKAYLLEKGVNG